MRYDRESTLALLVPTCTWGSTYARQAQTVYARRNSVDRIHAKDVELSQSSAQHTHVRFQHDGLSLSPLSEIGKTDEQDARQSESASTDGLASPGMPSLAA